jgi:hypothetical protein
VTGAPLPRQEADQWEWWRRSPMIDVRVWAVGGGGVDEEIRSIEEVGGRGRRSSGGRWWCGELVWVPPRPRATGEAACRKEEEEGSRWRKKTAGEGGRRRGGMTTDRSQGR